MNCVLVLNNCESAIIVLAPEDNYATFLTKVHQAVGVVLKKELSESAAFTYLDEDEDCISMSSELEFQEMKTFASSRKLLIINIIDLNVQSQNVNSVDYESYIYNTFKQNQVYFDKVGEVVVDFKDKLSTEIVDIKDRLSTELPKVRPMIESNFQSLVSTMSDIFTQENVHNVQLQISELFARLVERLPTKSDNNDNSQNINNDNVQINNNDDVQNNDSNNIVPESQNENVNNNNTGSTKDQMTEQERECINRVQELGFDTPNLLQIVRNFKCDLPIVLDHLIHLN